MLLLFGDKEGEVKNPAKFERQFCNNPPYNFDNIDNKMKVTFGFTIDKENPFCLLDGQWLLEARKYFVALQTSDFKQHQHTILSRFCKTDLFRNAFIQKNCRVLFLGCLLYKPGEIGWKELIAVGEGQGTKTQGV